MEATCPKCGSGEVKTGFFTVYGTSFLGIIGIVLCYILPAFLISEAILVAVGLPLQIPQARMAESEIAVKCP